MKKICQATLLVFMLMLVCMTAVHAQSTQQTLAQYISDLQKNPNDYALREKIIKHVQTMGPAPAIPEEARRYFIEGNALLKAAKEQKGYGLAIDSYRQCLLIAPWWAEAYNNYAVALELAGQFDESVNALKLYIATNPGEAESRKVQDKIYEIGAKKKIAANEKTGISSKQNAFEELLKKINGRRYFYNPTNVIDVKGRVFMPTNLAYPQYNYPSFDIRGRVSTYPMSRQPNSVIPWAVEFTFIISEDGDTITWRTRLSDGAVHDHIYLWKR